MEDEPSLQSLKNPKGKITKGELNKVIKLKNHDDKTRLCIEYIQLLDGVTNSKLKLMQLNAHIESLISNLIKTEPSSDLVADFLLLIQWKNLTTHIAKLKKFIKEAEADLDLKAYQQYPKLSEAEIKTLVVDSKWLSVIDTLIHGEMNRISQALTQRVKELAERYETPMPILANQVTEFESKVQQHLSKMGFAW